MIVQLDNLFINTNAIAVISPYEVITETSIEAGLCLNGVRYSLYKMENPANEDIEAIGQNTLNILQAIVKNMSIQPVQRLVASSSETSENE